MKRNIQNNSNLIIGIMGQHQIQHIIPVLREKYDVKDLRNNCKGKISKHIKWLQSMKKVDVVYNVSTSNHFWMQAKAAKLMHKKVMTHWIGTDVLHVSEGKTNPTKLSIVDKHFACFSELQKELHDNGIEAEVLPIIPFNLKFTLNKMPQEHAVLIYMPDGREEFYGYEVLKDVFQHASNTNFYIVANSSSEKFSMYKNVEVLGILSLDQMEMLYDKISIVIRNVKHDGLSMSVVEALAKGKKVIWNYSIPNVICAKTAQEICMELDKIIKEPPKVDIAAHEYVVENYTREAFLDIFSKALEEL